MFKLRFIGQQKQYEDNWAATVLGMLDEYEKKSKESMRLSEFIFMLTQRKRNMSKPMDAVLGERMEILIESAMKLDEMARKYCREKDLDIRILEEAKRLAEEFDRELREFRAMEELDPEMLEEIDAYYFDWRGLKYNARSRYFQRTWENYLRLHNKEFSEGKEAEYMAKSIAAASLAAAQPPIPYSRELVGKEAAKIMKNPIFKVMLKSDPGKMRDLIDKNHFDTITQAIGAPFKDEKKNMAKALAALDVIRQIGMRGALSVKTAAEWVDLYKKIGQITDTFKMGGMTDKAMSSGLSEIYRTAHNALKVDRIAKGIGPKDLRMVQCGYDVLSTLGSINKNASVMAEAEARRSEGVSLKDYGVVANFRRTEEYLRADMMKALKDPKYLLREGDVPASAVINRDLEKENVRYGDETDKKNKLDAFKCWLVIQKEMEMQGARTIAEFAMTAIGLAALSATPLYRESKNIQDLEKGYQYFMKANEYENAKAVMPKVSENTYDKFKAMEARKELLNGKDPAARMAEELQKEAQAAQNAAKIEEQVRAEMMRNYNNAAQIMKQYNQPMPFEPLNEIADAIVKAIEEPQKHEEVKPNNPVEKIPVIIDDLK